MHAGMEKILIDRCELNLQRLVQELQHLHITLHGNLSLVCGSLLAQAQRARPGSRYKKE
jgi:hypothetical protein